jgi:N-acetyl-anhydromuramyl-L-alanine amidase AmpD
MVSDGTLCRQASPRPGPLGSTQPAVYELLADYADLDEIPGDAASSRALLSRSRYDVPAYVGLVERYLPALNKVRFVTAYFQKPRSAGTKIDHIVVHDTGSGQPHFENSVRYLAHPGDGRDVSIHYLIGREVGQIVAMVPEDKKANHAKSYNDRSIGIELWKRDGDKGDFTNWQYEALSQLIYDLLLRHGIQRKNVIGHGSIEPRKRGEPHGFDWARLDDLLDNLSERVKEFYPKFAVT